MSSPQMMTMLGFLASAARAVPPAPISAVETVSTVRPYFIRSFRFIVLFYVLLFCFLCPWRGLIQAAPGKFGEDRINGLMNWWIGGDCQLLALVRLTRRTVRGTLAQIGRA